MRPTTRARTWPLQLSSLPFVALLCVAIGALAPPAAAEETIDFETAADGSATRAGDQFVTFPALGVEFNNALVAVECEADPPPGMHCLEARSGDFVAQSHQTTEFNREIADLEFEALQTFVTAYVRYDGGSGADGDDVSAVMRAYGDDGEFIGSTSETFTHDHADGQWHELTFSAPPEPGFPPECCIEIRRVEIYGGAESILGSPPDMQDENWLLVDDLTFEESAEAPEDTAPPSLDILDPPHGTTVENQVSVEVHLVAEDDRRLSAVDMEVRHESGEVVVEPTGGNVCGVGPAEPCPDTRLDDTVTADLRSGLEGTYTISFEACDAASNCSDASVNVVLEETDEVEVRAHYVELNQAVQNAVLPVFAGTEPAGVRLFTQRDTVVRYYLMADAATDLDVGPTLELAFLDGEGATLGASNVSPNTGQSLVSVPEAPSGEEERTALVREMREDLDRTLNYVIPGESFPEGTRRIELKLRGIPPAPEVVLGVRRIADRPMGLNVVRVQGTTGSPVGSSAFSRAKIRDDVVDYLEAAFPISGVQVDWRGTWTWDTWDDPVLFGGPTCPELFDVTSCLLNDLSSAWDGRLNEHDGVDWATVVGVADLPGNNGRAECAGDTALSDSFGNVAAQEIGHNLGLGHVDSTHNSGESNLESTLFSHGAFGNYDTSVDPHDVTPSPWGNMGIAAQESGGTWDLTLIAPGKASGTHVHEFMSYGGSTSVSPYTVQGANGEWVSDEIYLRIENQLRTRSTGDGGGCGVDTASAGALADPPDGQVAPRQESDELVGALLFSALLDVDEAFHGMHLEPRPLPRARVEAEREGAFTLELEDASGTVLAARSFDPIHVPDGPRMIKVAVPFVEGVDRLVVRRDGTTLAEMEASPSAPRVEVLSPNGGEILQGGEHTVRWEAEDPDGEPPPVVLEYSHDGGDTWHPLGRFAGTTQETRVNVAELEPGRRGVIRIGASDGVNTAEDRSDGFFSVGTGEPPAEGGPEDPSTGGSLSVAAGPGAPPAELEIEPGARDVAVLQVELAAEGEAARLQGMTLEAAGSGDDRADVESVRVVHDVDGDGQPGEGEAVLARGLFDADDGELLLEFSEPLEVASGEGVHLLVVYDFGGDGAADGAPASVAWLPLALLVVLAAPVGRRRWLPALMATAVVVALPACGAPPADAGLPEEAPSYEVRLTGVDAVGGESGDTLVVDGLPVEGSRVRVSSE